MSDRENHDGNLSFNVDAAIPEARLVKMDSATVVSAAGLAETPLGVTSSATFAAGDGVNVRALNRPGTVTMEASKAIAINTVVYGAALGKITDSSASSAVRVGISMEVAAADGDYIQVMPD